MAAGGQLHGIVAGSDGALWFTDYFGNRIGRITTAGVITEFTSGMTAGSGPAGIAAGPDGALWFTESAGRIGRIAPSAPSVPTLSQGGGLVLTGLLAAAALLALIRRARPLGGASSPSA